VERCSWSTSWKAGESDLLERRGSGYVGKHGGHPPLADPWFRSLNLKYGPTAASSSTTADVGECHDQKSVHRTSGRLYKVVHGTPKPVEPFDLAKKTDLELVALQLHPNEWWVRQSRRILQERAIAGRDLADARTALRKILAENPDVTRKLRALWALHCTGGADLVPLLDHENEHVRAWAVRLLSDDRKALPEKLASDPSPLVRLFLASALQRMEPAAWPIVEARAARRTPTTPSFPSCSGTPPSRS
jgi:hypothetical protein